MRKIYIDTSVLLHPAVRSMFAHIKNRVSAMEDYREEFIILSSVINELEEKIQDPELCYRAEFVLNIIKASKFIKIINVESDYGEKKFHADYYILNEITKWRMQTDIGLISNDRALTREVTKLNESKSVLSNYDIMAWKLSEYGNVISWDGNKCQYDELEDRFMIDLHFISITALDIISSQIIEADDEQKRKELYITIANYDDNDNPHKIEIIDGCNGIDIYQLQDLIEQYMLIIENEKRNGLIQ